MVSHGLVFGIVSVCLLGTAFCTSANSDVVPLASTRAVSHNIYDCINTSVNKTRLYSTVINEDRVFLGYVTKTITFPSSGTNSDLITCIVVTDNDSNDEGGYPSISSGGVSSYSVEIVLKSQWNKGLHFTVQLYTDA